MADTIHDYYVDTENYDEQETPILDESLVDEQETPILDESLVDEGETPILDESLVDEGEIPILDESLVDEGEIPILDELLVDEEEIPIIDVANLSIDAVNLSSIIPLVITGGECHTIAIMDNGSLWAWGLSGNGQLGTGSTSIESRPKRIGTDYWKSAAAGLRHTVAIKSDGSLWAWGDNQYGRLGDGTSTTRLSPVRIGTDTNWTSVSAGEFHTLALKSDGSLWAWGYNLNGRLGDGTTTQRTTPTRIGTATDWISVSAGSHHSLAIKSDGSLWAWGLNTNGRLGDGTSTQCTTPKRIGTDTHWISVSGGEAHTVAIKSDGSLWAWGDGGQYQLGDGKQYGSNKPIRIGNDTDWASASASWRHTMAVKSDGSLWAWGDGTNGKLGIGFKPAGTTLNRVGTDLDWVSVSTGKNHTMGIKSDGNIWTWGYNYDAQLGNGTRVNSSVPVLIIVDTTTLAAPIITKQPTSQSVIEEQTVTFTVEASGNPTPSFQWQISTNNGGSWTNISAQTTRTLTLANVTTDLNGNLYRCVATNSVGTATSNAATLTVNPQPAKVAPIITKQPTGQSVTAEQNATFTVEASGNPTPSFQWQISTNNGGSWTNLSGQTSNTLAITKATTNLNGNLYRCVATNSEGTATSSVATLTVNPLPPINRSGSVTLWNYSTGVEILESNLPGTTNRTIWVNYTNDLADLTGSVNVYDSSGNIIKTQGISQGNFQFSTVSGETYRIRFYINNNSARIRNFDYTITSID